LTRDPDTLDTWFSSALWPFSILGWPNETTELRCWYPSQALLTGGEIIFLWVARMVMMGLHVMGSIPFHDVVITPLVFDSAGRKMSKSLGNVIDPMDLANRYGADAFRLSILRQMRLESQEIRYQESRCEEARNFNNKIWNATRYMLSLDEGLPSALTLPPSEELTIADRWILTRLQTTAARLGNAFDAYDFGIAAETIWRFVWYEFCDWYLEATKLERNRATRAGVLSFVWNHAMRLLHPIAPFITEEVWQALPHDGATIMTATWPDPLEIPAYAEAAANFELLTHAVERLRNLRADYGLRPKERATLDVPENLPEEIADFLGFYAVATLNRTSAAPGALADMLGAVVIRAPQAALEQRYQKDIVRLQSEIERGEKKLANEAFVAKAAPHVVAGEREKLEGYRAELARTEAALQTLKEPA
jgi:valyl-tRNA synthetase